MPPIMGIPQPQAGERKISNNISMEIFKKDYIIGLDIGASSVKLALFVKKNGSLALSQLRSAEITKEKDSAIALKEILLGIDLKHSRCVSLFNDSRAMVKRIVAPPMPQAELKEAIALEAKNYFPFPVNDCLIDFEIVGEAWEKDVKKIEILLAVCPHEAIKAHLALLKPAGIQPERIMHPSLALCTLLRLRKEKADVSIAALDIGKDVSDVIIVKNKNLVFSRKIPIAGDDFTKALMAMLFSSGGKVQLTYEEAEKIKREYGLPQENTTTLIENKLTASQILFLLRPWAEKLSHEIERSFDFYREESQGERIEKLLLAGGSAQLKGLDKFLSEGLGIGVEVLHSLEGIDMAAQTLEKDMAINRIAMAVGAGVDKPSGINLLPIEVKQEMLRIVQRAMIKAIVSGCVTILALFFIGLRIYAVNLDKKIASARFELQALKQQIGEIKDYSGLSDCLARQPYYEDVFKEVSNVIPSGIYLKELQLQKGIINLKGVVASTITNPEEVISIFARSLEAGLFQNVKFIAIQEAAGVKEFKLQMEIR